MVGTSQFEVAQVAVASILAIPDKAVHVWAVRWVRCLMLNGTARHKHKGTLHNCHDSCSGLVTHMGPSLVQCFEQGCTEMERGAVGGNKNTGARGRVCPGIGCVIVRSNARHDARCAAGGVARVTGKRTCGRNIPV